MWFVFPQLRGLGRSPMAQHYGINDLAEARAYLGHAVLRSRLKECLEAVLGVSGKMLHEIFGSPNDTKFRSSMTLFAMANGHGNLFKEALDKYCDGQMGPATLKPLSVVGSGK